MASNRKYATISEVEEFADITSTDDTEFEDRISQCEELIDAYVGFQEKSVPGIHIGKATNVSGTTIFDTSSDTPLYSYDDNYFTYCVVEIIAGLGSGQQRPIASSSRSNKSITVASAWTTQPDTTSVYKIYQLGKFPRLKDVYHDPDVLTYSKSIPEAVKRAVAAQVAFMVNKGDDYFAGDSGDLESETIGNYSYSKGQGGSASASASVRLVSPRARTLLRGYKFSGGRLISENPTCL